MRNISWKRRINIDFILVPRLQLSYDDKMQVLVDVDNDDNNTKS